MVSKQEQRAEETKKTILIAAGKLFSERGYDSVTMRQIAKEAGCSHTTIYLYFKDKEALLHQLSMPFLHDLYQQLQQISLMDTISAEDRLKRISRKYIHFCLVNRNMYSIFINAKSSKVDEENPDLEINKLRVKMFGIIKQVLGECLGIPNNEQLIAYSRIFFFNINGVLNTYSYPHEPIEVLMERLTPTFDLSIEILIIGIKEKLKRGEDKDEN
ncbi:TetR/AcrR family transcriptional regulator [Heyndrickxia sp. NPDC080065]|uniref:TetR/AcrR family transcriptional regulator n=1 Tax=Heyndrickxia sp. NPDC080065 TaxID=3390568 RepID=UPI003D086026